MNVGKQPAVVQICPCYVDFQQETGGVANVVRQICLHLSATGRQVILLCGNTELGKTVAAPGKRRINEWLTVEVFSQRSHPMVGPVGELQSRLHTLPKDCVAHVHTCFSRLTETAMDTFHKKGIPFVFSPHGKLSSSMIAKNYWLKWLWWSFMARRHVQHATKIALMSSGEAELFSTLRLQSGYEVIPNGYQPLPDSADIGKRLIYAPYVLFLGYLDPRKQPEFLVRAFARSQTKVCHELVFVGPDAYGHQASIEDCAQACGLENKVRFLGSVYGREKWNLLFHAACLCLPSRAEGMPVVLCEALGAGLPLVYSAACNFPEITVRGAGIQLDRFDTALWAAAIDRVCLDRVAQTEMKHAAFTMAEEYTWRRITDRWNHLYHVVFHEAEAAVRF
jgi:glycosyltransferase involved in cell wall biosynthesis